MSRAAEIEAVIAQTAVQSILSAPLGDGCLRTTIVAREMAGTHHRAPRVRRAWPAVGSMTREAWHRSTNSPARHVISNLLVSITRTRSPVGNVFSLIAVRELLWKGTGAAGRVKGVGRDVFMSSVQLCCESAMTGSSVFWPEKAPLTSPQIEGK